MKPTDNKFSFIFPQIDSESLYISAAKSYKAYGKSLNSNNLPVHETVTVLREKKQQLHL